MIATRGEERRRWVQVLTDTPENQENNVIDELWVEREGELVRLENKGNAEVYRLYSWTLPPQLEAPSPGPTQEATLTLGEETLSCTASTGTAKLQGQPVSFSFLTCPDFLWTHGEGTIGPSEGPPLWQMRVVSDSRD